MCYRKYANTDCTEYSCVDCFEYYIDECKEGDTRVSLGFCACKNLDLLSNHDCLCENCNNWGQCDRDNSEIYVCDDYIEGL